MSSVDSHFSRDLPSSAEYPYAACDALTPAQVTRALNVDTLHEQGITGTGITVVLPINATHPRLAEDLASFSETFGLPPAQLEVIAHEEFGRLPDRSPGHAAVEPVSLLGAQEAASALEMVHMIAPAAQLVLLSTPTVDESRYWCDPMILSLRALRELLLTETVHVAFQPMAYAERLYAQRGVAPRDDRHRQQRYQNRLPASITRLGTTLLAASGNEGAVSFDHELRLCHPVVNWPASHPDVCAVGGTCLHVDARGERTAPDTLYADAAFGQASGGGRSTVYRRPGYQDRVKQVVGRHRGLPDISLPAADACRIWVSNSFDYVRNGRPGWSRYGGTSMAVSLAAGLVALAADLNGGSPLGAINPTLYSTPPEELGLTDITTGTTTIQPGGYHFPGHPARIGYDLATGLGGITDATAFATALARRNR